MTSTLSGRSRMVLAIVAGTLACGLPLWPIPYSKVSLPGNPSALVWWVGAALAGAFAAWLIREKTAIPALAVMAGYVAAVLGRVVVDTIRDPTSHNLWPFEVVIAATFGGVGALIGVGVMRGILGAAHKAA